MAAGGVNENNFESIVQNTGVSDVHGTQIVGKLQ
jgi:copper homeostasis protein CutC